jgi:hypothetical protein
MTKDELEKYAKDRFGVEIDKRRRIDDIVAQVESLEKNKGKPAEPDKPAARAPKLVRNLFTGVVWPWNPIYKGNADLEVVEWE